MRQHHYPEGPPSAALKYLEPVDRQGAVMRVVAEVLEARQQAVAPSRK
ncbi:MAG: hypothetical protein L0387_04815 [Acidobacteria bacterium]|nr:hypothetical protein [Acidobacteriota bacterium]